jgi:hypothetical protein
MILKPGKFGKEQKALFPNENSDLEGLETPAA